MKKCPFCAEEIQDEAIKCKHCGEALTLKKEINTNSAQKIKEGGGCGPMICSLLICGSGQMIKGQVGRGLLFMLFAIIIGALTSWIFCLGAIIVIIISVIDASSPVYKCSKCRVIVDSNAQKCKSCQSDFLLVAGGVTGDHPRDLNGGHTDSKINEEKYPRVGDFDN